MVWHAKGCKLLGYSNSWLDWREEISSRLKARNISLLKTLGKPPCLFLVQDPDLIRVRQEIETILGIPFTDHVTGDVEDGLTEAVGEKVVVVICDSIWQGFTTNEANCTASVFHELGHVEERLKFGAFPDENHLRNCRIIWAEFFAEQIAAPVYGRDRPVRLANGLVRETHRGEIERATASLGRILGFAYGKPMDVAQFWRMQALCGTAFSETTKRLWPILVEGLQADALPDLGRIYGALDPLLGA